MDTLRKNEQSLPQNGTIIRINVDYTDHRFTFWGWRDDQPLLSTWLPDTQAKLRSG